MADIIPGSSEDIRYFFIPTKDGKCIIVDAQMPGYEEKILQDLENAGFAKENVVLIVLTHAHLDHIGSMAAVKEATGAPVLVHESAAEACTKGEMPANSLNPTSFGGRMVGWYLKYVKGNHFVSFEPDVVVSDDMYSLADYGAPHCKIVFLPGHTDGSIGILWESRSGSRQLVAGDAIGYTMRGNIGKPNFAVSEEQMIATIGKIIEMSPVLTHVGHGGPYTLETIRDFHNSLTS